MKESKSIPISQLKFATNQETKTHLEHGREYENKERNQTRNINTQNTKSYSFNRGYSLVFLYYPKKMITVNYLQGFLLPYTRILKYNLIYGL